MPALTAAPMTPEQARDLATWRYPAPYDAYDFPAWDVMTEQGWAITRPERYGEFRAVLRGGALAGWFWVRRVEGVPVLGCGLAPQECGRGSGAALMSLVVQAAGEAFPGEPLELAVRPFNVRARRCYLAAGFAEVGERDGMVVMRREAETPRAGDVVG